MKSKVRNSKYAKRAIKRLIEENQDVFDSLARGSEVKENDPLEETTI